MRLTMPKPSILITGTTGNVGKELTKELLARKVRFRAMVERISGLRRMQVNIRQ